MTHMLSVCADSTPRPVDQQAELPQIGTWQPTDLIGEGTLTQVYRARPVDRGDVAPCYAVKVLRRKWEDEPRAVDLIRREAQVGRVVSNPHVVPVLAHGANKPPYYITMPLLPGATLADHLSAGCSLSVPIALWIARQVAEGLDGLYTVANMMHADIKPSNIFVAPDGHATLIDLGYARPMDQRPTLNDRPLVGTLSYIAPEMVTSALAADIRSDIYSLGVTLYQMLAGTLPFEAADPATVAVLQRDAVPHRLDQLNPGIPTQVADLVQQMLAKEPLRRPQTPAELADVLVALEIRFFAHRSGFEVLATDQAGVDGLRGSDVFGAGNDCTTVGKDCDAVLFHVDS
jgi:eukaryotic-like serine/threonine-protein kinase